MTQSASQKVLQTYELLESILLHLSIHDLFLIQTVCKQWLSLILRSQPLQSAMFLSSPYEPLKPVNSPREGGRARTVYPSTGIRINPAAAIQGCRDDVRGAIATFGLWHHDAFMQFDIRGMPVYEKRIAHRDASWRDMLLTQPPITAVNLEFIRREPFAGAMTIYRPQGVRFGDLHDWLVRLAEEYEIETGRDPELGFSESLSFCVLHPKGTRGVVNFW